MVHLDGEKEELKHKVESQIRYLVSYQTELAVKTLEVSLPQYLTFS